MWLGDHGHVTRPDQDSPVLIRSESLAVHQLFRQVRKRIVVQIELAFERPIGHAPSLAQERNRLIDHTIKVHGDPFCTHPL
jgi:hypothetical protein